ncbi:energy transducer TonB [Hymenobacter cellulosilyticus]|uniref:TonB family protein n=1 Tax=Hymenobacter cellulosilyticus TaxID=2932248 RepID=A0A8T9Q5U5_9BACT|nr:energy transducer TonB [Hymenobacter cellulosilyticus]UOQ73026.1 TonB family protein [Hymenobacter cellulosilyticus]
MLDLPILNVRLNACSESWQQMTPTAQGRHCHSCDREVIDFTSGTQADLNAARAASPDGQLCGMFRREQVAAVTRPQLRPKLRRFVVALVLVCGLGLSSQEAWAQVRKARPATKRTPPKQEQVEDLNEDVPVEPLIMGGVDALAFYSEQDFVPVAPSGPYTHVEQMPEFKDGGWAGLLDFIRRNQQWPVAASAEAEGKVFVKFVIDKTGRIQNAEVLKTPHPTLNAEALRIVQLLEGRFVPGRQNGQAVDVSYTIAIPFMHL